MAQKAWILPVETVSHHSLHPPRVTRPEPIPRSHDPRPTRSHPIVQRRQAHRRMNRHPICSPLLFLALMPRNFLSLVRQTTTPLIMPRTTTTPILRTTLVAQAVTALVLAPEQNHTITYVIYHDHLRMIKRRPPPAALTVVARATFPTQSHMTICVILHARASRNQDKRLLRSHVTRSRRLRTGLKTTRGLDLPLHIPKAAHAMRSHCEVKQDISRSP